MKILGFNCFGHDSAAALLVNDQILFAVEEERLTRKKHDGSFPYNSIKKCLEYSNLKLSDIDHVCFSWDPRISYKKIPLYFFRYFWHVPTVIREARQLSIEENLGGLRFLRQMQRLPDILKEKFPENVGQNFKFHLLEHHLTHAASAFLCSPFEEAAIMTIDGAGEWTTALMCHGKGNKIEKLSWVDTPYSLGAFYQAIARYLGFALIEGPGKLMGLASYGKRNGEVYKKFRNFLQLLPEGKFKFDMSYFSYHYTRRSGVSAKFIKEFGLPKEEGKDWTEHELEIAAAAQQIVEDVYFHIAEFLKKKTKLDNLCIAGGVGLNSVANGLLTIKGLFKDIFIQPAAGDSGTSIGSALYLNHCILNRPRKWVMKTAFLGPEYSDEDYLREIKKARLPYITTDEQYSFAVKQLKEGKIIAWHQGRLEFGPRALGNRSIIANPCLPEMKDLLNKRVKFRESFRPFAAIVLEEDCGTYFNCDYPDPYMLRVYYVKPEYQDKLPSITHVDKSVRIQTVNKSENPQMWNLLTSFKKETGFGVLINTSFNIKGEPIVCSAYDAVDSFIRADMDYLVIGNFIVGKEHNAQELFDWASKIAIHKVC